MDPTTQTAAFLIIMLIFVVNALVMRRDEQAERPIRAFDSLSRMAGTSIETSQPMHFSLGSATIGDETTMLAMVGSEFVYYAARAVAIGDAAPLFTVSQGAAVPLTIDTLRRAYHDEGRSDQYNLFSSRWYPTGPRSLAFAGALSAIQTEDEISGNILTGRYGIELALILDTTYRHQKSTIAVSDRLDGQAVAYALADDALIGEEVFVAAGYLSQDHKWLKRISALDAGRWFLIAGIIVLVIFNLVTGG